jgi:hypothetical protein
MRRFVLAALMLSIVAGPLFAETQNHMFQIPCSVLWPAVRDTVRNSGNYAVVFMDNTEMTASFAIGVGQSLRIDSAVLDARGDACEMRVQPLYQGPFNNDGVDFKKRVDKTLAALKSSQQPAPAKTDTGNK